MGRVGRFRGSRPTLTYVSRFVLLIAKEASIHRLRLDERAA